MPRLNLYEQQTSAQGPRASGGDFGAAPAQALGEMGNVVADIGARIQRREELFASDQIMGEIDTWAVTALDDFQKRQDITTQQALPEFQNALKQKKQEALSKSQGSPESRAALERQLDNQMTQYGKSAIGAKIKAGHEQLTRGLNQQFDKSANEVGTAPQILQDSISENIAYVESRKSGMDADMYQKAMVLARAKPIQSAVQSYVANGNWDQAEAIMADPEVNKLLDPSVARPLRIDIAVGRGKQEKEKREVEQDRRVLSYLLGTEATLEQAAAAAGVSNMPWVQKLNVLKMMNGGRELPQETVNRVIGIERQVSESKIQQITDMAMDYNSLDAAGRMKLGLLIKSEFRDINGVDSLGNPTRYSTVPAELQRFVEPTGGRPGAGGITGSVATGQGTDTGPFLDPKGQMYAPGTKITMPDGVQATIDSRGHAIADAPAAGGAAPSSTSSMQDGDVIDLYENAGKIVGLEAWIKRNAANLPLNIGDSLKISPVYGRAAQASQIIQNDIVRGFVNMGGGKDVIANQYRQELKSIVSIDPKIFGSERELQFKFQNIDAELRKKLKDYQNTAQTGATQDMRTTAAEGVSVVNNILARLNVPQKRVNTREEVQKLAPGTKFLYRDDPTPQVRK